MKQFIMFNVFEKEAIRQFLDDKLKEGWVLTNFSKNIYHFRKLKNESVYYGIGTFSKSNKERVYYDDFMSSFGWEKIGEQNGIVIFKNDSNEEFYSDETIDKKYERKMILKQILKDSIIIIPILINTLNLILTIKYLSLYDFISNNDIFAFCTLIILLLTFFYNRGIPLIQYKLKHVETNYKKIEKRSWIFIILIVGCLMSLLFFKSSILENYFLQFLIIYWCCILGVGFITYYFRNRINNLINISITVIIILFACSIIFLANNHKNIIVNNQSNEVSSIDIPLSYLKDESDYILDKNKVNQSLVMKKQVVREKTEQQELFYVYYEFYQKNIRDLMNKKTIESNLLDGFEKRNDVEWYFWNKNNQNDYRTLFVTKGNEGYLFMWYEISEEEVLEIVDQIEWKS